MTYFAYDEKGNALPFLEERTDNRITLTLKKETFAHAKSLTLFPELSRAAAGDAGFYLLPRNIEMLRDVQVFFKERSDTSFSYKHPVMSLFGICRADGAVLVRIKRNYKFAMTVSVKDGVYTATPTLTFGGKLDTPWQDISVELLTLPAGAGLADMARAERELRLTRGEIRPLAEKCRERAVVDYARRFPLIRIRMGWKQSPSPILHQTPENEPPMHVACDFARVRDIADELKRQGVEGAELQLVGWNKSGHDGAFPQIFPVDERLGGEAEMKRTITHVKALGYRISTHTNWLDTCELADTYDPDDICRTEDGTLLQVGHYSAGLAYHVCPRVQLEHAMREEPRLAALGENGLHFTDVASIIEPDCCYHPDHPVHTGEGVTHMQNMMRYTKGLYGGFSSEGCFDFALSALDYGLYVTFGDGFGNKQIPLADRYVPFFELTYHGILLYNPASPTVNYPIKRPLDRLSVFLLGGRPTFYYYSRFRTGHANWMGEVDFTCDSQDDLKSTVAMIKASLDEYTPVAHLQNHFLLDYIFDTDEKGAATGVEIALYDNGERIVANVTEKETEFEGITLAPYTWKSMGI